MNFILTVILVSITFAQVSDGYVLYTPGGQGVVNNFASYLRDTDNSVFNSWSHSRGPASMPYLVPGDDPGFENTLLYYPTTVPNPTMDTGGVGGKVEIYNWDGDLLWSYTLSNNDYQHHHDIEPLPNKNFLIIAWERKYSNEWSSMGRTSVNNSLNQMWSTVIFEIEPNLETGEANIVWEWHLWDHLVQDRGPNYGATYGEISDHPELMDINCNTVGSDGIGPGGNANGDWIHVNAISYNADLKQIILSSRHMSEIYIIEHTETSEIAAGHTGGIYGKGGDFLYRWGNPQNYDRGNNSDQILDAQHSVNWIPVGYPGEGNLILFNNFHTNSSSAALEFIPPLNPDGTYNLEDGEPYGPDSYNWIHTGGFQSNAQGGTFRLENGNTLITVATESYIFEIDTNGNTVWSYDYPSNNAMIPRAQKYSYDYFDNILSLGDINQDEIINILDIILTVNIILGTADFNQNADMNQDGIINILDVVNLLNTILGNN